MRFGRLLVIASVLALAASSCGDGDAPTGEGSNPTEKSASFFSTMRELVLEVAYEPGAEPYTGSTVGGMDYWQITIDNLNALFDGRSVTLTVPNQLSEMKAIAAQSQATWTTAELLALAEASRTQASTAEKAVFVVLFLNGYLEGEDGAARPQVIGVSLGNTTVVALFKDVIESTGTLLVPTYVEQSTIVHEVGHGLGLVNNGIPLASAHHDAEHGAHCSNEDCVMHWLNEGASDAVQFVQRFITSGETVMFAPECLADAKAYAP